MDVQEAIRGRRAVRNYRDEPVEREVLQALIEIAVWAPSGINRQPWRFFIVEGRDALARISAEAKALMLKEADHRPDLAAVRPMLTAPDSNIFYNAPALIIICSADDDEMAVKDCCLAAQTLMLAAYAGGQGTCWIGFSEAWLNTPEAKAELGIPEAMRPVAPIIIGHPAGDAHPGERRAPEIHFAP